MPVLEAPASSTSMANIKLDERRMKGRGQTSTGME